MVSQGAKNKLILFLLYMKQGMILNFFMGSLPMIFAEYQVPLEYLGLYHLTTMGFSIKIFFAPFVDIFYFENFGKRKSFIVPMNYIISITMIISSFWIETLVQQHNLRVVGLIAFLTTFPIAVQDVAVDSWALELLPNQNDQFSMIQSVGMSVGGSVLTSIGFNVLHSYKMISVMTFMLANGVFWLAFNIYLHLYVKEKFKPRESQETKYEQIKEITVILSNLWHNKNMRKLLLIVFFEKFFWQPIDGTFKLKIIQMGVSKAIVSTAETFIFPAKLLTPIIFTNYFKEYNTMSSMPYLLSYKCFESLVVFTICLSIKNNQIDYKNGYLIYIVLFIVFSSWWITYETTYLVKSNLFYQVLTEGFEGTILTSLNSVNNIGSRVSMSSALFIIDKVNYVHLGILTQLSYMIFIYKTADYFKSLHKVKVEEWQLMKPKEKKD